MKESEESFATLRENVTSKGGVTFEALKVLQEGNLLTLFHQALEAAAKRSGTLSREIAEKLK